MTVSRVSKRLLALLFVALLGATVAACGSDDSSSDNGSDSKARTGSTDGETTTGATGATGSQDRAGTTGATGSEGTTDASAVDMVGSGRYFAANSPWNTRIDNLPVASNSSRMLELAMRRRFVREEAGEQGIETLVRRVNEGLFINTDAWAPLVVEAGGDDAEATKFVCRQSKCGSAEIKVPEEIPIPANTTPDPRYDGWLSVIDRAKGVGYDFWRARRQLDDTISYQYSKAWTLDGPGFSKPYEDDPERAVGARGSGLPLFAGMISPAEAENGEINHALAISVPGLARRNYVQPASVTDGVGSQKSLPAGARIRLRPNVIVAASDRRQELELGGDRQRAAEAILATLREYGAIVVDRSVVPTLYSPKGTSRRLIQGSELSWLTLSDFEVVELPMIYKDPPLSQVLLEGPGTDASEGTTPQSEEDFGEGGAGE